MFAIAFILLVALFNFGIGFGLAVHLGHGPPGVELPSPNSIRRRLMRRSSHSTNAGHHGSH